MGVPGFLAERLIETTFSGSGVQRDGDARVNQQVWLAGNLTCGEVYKACRDSGGSKRACTRLVKALVNC
jgi:hypothetical protein